VCFLNGLATENYVRSFGSQILDAWREVRGHSRANFVSAVDIHTIQNTVSIWGRARIRAADVTFLAVCRRALGNMNGQ
jgi:hypothetical protein